MRKSICFLLSFFCFLIVLCVASVSLYASLEGGATPLSKPCKVVHFQVPQGATGVQVAQLLKTQGLIKSKTLFLFKIKQGLLPLEKKPFLPQAGVYAIDTHKNMNEIALILQEGRQDFITVSFAEGLSYKAMGRILQQKGVCSQEDFALCVKSRDILQTYGIQGDSVQGYLFPDTYYFVKDMSAFSVVTTMIDNFFAKLKQNNILQDIKKQELNDLVILASIVEKEYKVENEAPLIASVFKNRLSQNIGLYSCATIEYIITDILDMPHKQRITYKDLSLESPYNTYKWAGLPPGAICNPGLVAIKAVLDAPKTNYLFFRVLDETKGTHSFSSNFEQHKEQGLNVKVKE